MLRRILSSDFLAVKPGAAGFLDEVSWVFFCRPFQVLHANFKRSNLADFYAGKPAVSEDEIAACFL